MPSLTNHLSAYGSRTALVDDTTTITYAELAQRVDGMVKRLGPQRRLVSIAMTNSVDSVVAYLGALAAGHAVIVVGPNSTEIDSNYDPDIVINHGRIERCRAESVHQLHPDLALLLSTSGSTGSPKLVRLSYRNVESNARSIAQYLALTDRDRAMTTLPPYYCYGLSVINSHLLVGAGIVLNEASVIEPEFWDRMRANRCTSIAGVPHTFDLLERADFGNIDLPHLRYVTAAGGRLAPKQVRRFARLGQLRGWELFVMYGATEATARMGYLPPQLALDHPDCIGIAIPGGHFSIDASGELEYTGPNVMMGYADSSVDLAKRACVEMLKTGDLASWTDDGLVKILGRKSRFAKIFGLRIDLEHVESELDLDGVQAMCAESDGCLVVAVVNESTVINSSALNNGSAVTADSGVAGRAAAIAGLPRSAVSVVQFEKMPRLPSGKPDFAAIRAAAARADQTADDFAMLYASVLHVDRREILPTSTFVNLGGDSLSYVTMSVRLEGMLGHLPADWASTPISELRPTTSPAILRTVETSVLLRAAAIILVVGSHAGLFTLWGGAHVLLTVAGFNFARFVLTAAPRTSRLKQVGRSIAGIAIPSMVWIGVVMVTGSAYYSVSNLFLVQKIVGPDGPTQGHLWFIELIVQLLVLLTLVFAIPQVDAIERLFPLGFAIAALAVALSIRFDLWGYESNPHSWATVHGSFYFAIGWVCAKATNAWVRVLASIAVVVATVGYFHDHQREATIIAGVLLLIWLRTVRMPAFAVPGLALIAASSLYIYLVHWQVLTLLGGYPTVAMLVSLGAGVVLWSAYSNLSRVGSISGIAGALRRGLLVSSSGRSAVSRS